MSTQSSEKVSRELFSIKNPTPVVIVDHMLHMIHPAAANELKDNTLIAVRAWVKDRIKALHQLLSEPEKSYVVRLSSNAYYDCNVENNPFKKKPIGLQSVSVDIIDPAHFAHADHIVNSDEHVVLLPGETKSPTIDVIAPGLLQGNSVFTFVEFLVANGQKKVLTVLSDGMIVGSVDPVTHIGDGGEWSTLPEPDGGIAMPLALLRGQSIAVSAPSAVATIVEVMDEDAVMALTNYAVYACLYEKQ